MTSGEVSILTLAEREQWTREHASAGLPSQSWSYASALAASGIEPKLAVVRSAQSWMLLPFFERERRGLVDVCTLYGLSGASACGDANALFTLWREFAVRKGWVAGYIQLSPLTRVPVLNDQSELSWRGPVFLFEPTAFAAQVFPRTIRRKLKAAQCLQPTLVDDTQALAPRLVDLYPRTLPRGAAAAGKHFSLATLDRWARDSDSLLLGASVGGSVEAVILFRRAGGHAEAHVLGHTERGRQLDAWLYCEAIERLFCEGVQTINLGGGASAGDGISEFKARLGGKPVQFAALHQIYDASAYDVLCEHAGARGQGSYFPAYRDPRASRPPAE